MPALAADQIERALANVETEIATARKRMADAISAARTEGNKQLAGLKEEKQLLLGLRRIAGRHATSPAAAPSAPRTAAKRSTTTRRTRAKRTRNVGVPERREQIIRLVAQAPLGASGLAAQLKLSRTRISQIAEGMVKDGTLRRERLTDGRSARVVYAAASAAPASAAAEPKRPTGGTAKTRRPRTQAPAAS
jgi:hypothetical protein